MEKITVLEDAEGLQQNLEKLENWSDTWLRVIIISGTAEWNNCVSFRILLEYDNLQNGTGSVPVFTGVV